MNYSAAGERCGSVGKVLRQGRKPAWRMELSTPGSLWRAPSAGSAGFFLQLFALFALLGCTNVLPLSKFITVYFCLSQQEEWISGQGTSQVMKHSYALEN